MRTFHKIAFRMVQLPSLSFVHLPTNRGKVRRCAPLSAPTGDVRGAVHQPQCRPGRHGLCTDRSTDAHLYRKVATPARKYLFPLELLIRSGFMFMSSSLVLALRRATGGVSRRWRI